jgi:hypothetical protein
VRLTLNALVGVILLIFSIFLAFIIGTKFFNKQDPCLDSFFYLYQTINELKDNSYTEISLYGNKECLIAYYPKTSLLFDETFFNSLKKSNDKTLSDFYRSLLKYPVSYGCTNILNFEGCSNFSNFYSISQEKNKDLIIQTFKNANLRLAFSVAGFTSLYFKRLLWKKTLEMVKSVILKKLEKKIAEKTVEKTTFMITKKVAMLAAGVVLMATPIGLLVGFASLAISAYSAYEFLGFLHDSYQTWKLIENALTNYQFFWSNHFLNFLLDNYKEELRIFYLDDQSKNYLKGKEGSLIFCKRENNLCKFSGDYFFKLKSVDYVSGDLALIYPVFFENALVYFSNENVKEKKYGIFKLKLVNNKSLVVLMSKDSPFFAKAKNFFDILNNKNLFELSKKDYVNILVEKEGNLLKPYVLFYGLLDNSKLLNPGQPLIIDPEIDLNDYLNEHVLNIIKKNLEQDSEKNNVVVSIDHSLLRINNEQALFDFYNKIGKDLNFKFKNLLENIDLSELSYYFLGTNLDETVKNKMEKDADKFLKSFVQEKFYKYYILSYFLNYNVKNEEFLNLFKYLVSHLNKANFPNFSKKFDLLMVFYLITNNKDFSNTYFSNFLTSVNEESSISYDYNQILTQYLREEELNKFDKLNLELQKVFYSYNLEKHENDFYDSLNNIFDFILSQESIRYENDKNTK